VIRGAVGFLITAVAISASLMLLRLTPATTDWFIKEDGPIEDFGAICLFGASAFVVLALFHLRRAKVSRIKLASYACCALFLFIAGGEEISWGQRFLGIQTPQIIAKINVQGEINLHNLYGNEHGQNMSVIIFRMFWFVLGVALPLLQAGAHFDVSSSDIYPSSLSGSLSPSSINSCCGGRSRLCGCKIQGHGPVPTPTATLDPRNGSESRHRPRRWQGTIELLRG
jgi:hypothetical protein